MTKNDTKNITACNECFEIKLSLDSGLKVEGIMCGGVSWLPTVCELFELYMRNTSYPASAMQVRDVFFFTDSTQEMVSILLEQEPGIEVRVCLLLNSDQSVNILAQLALQFDDCPEEIYLHVPLLSALRTEATFTRTFPGKPAAKADGSSVVIAHPEIRLPFCLFEEDTGNGICVDFPAINEGLIKAWDMNRNHDFLAIASFAELESHRFLLRPNNVFSTIFELNLTAVKNGWKDCFELARQKARINLSEEEYNREDLKWYQDTLLHHFSFLYGYETYNYEKGQVDLESLLKQGEEFGGYNALLLWNQYPRLGVDSRNQWDFFAAFPDGINGLRKLVDLAHAKGIRVFLPYKPWDIGVTESAESVQEKVSTLIRDTDIDGIFFDTMDSAPEGLREAIDRVKPGVVFCTESKPKTFRTLKLITGSWDKYSSPVPMPEINLLRFVVPEHFSPINARWHVGMKKDLLIKRAVFNGTGIVIWQDIFGAWLPYSQKQKQEIRKWKQIFTKNKNILFCKKPVPLYPTLHEGLLCNYFPADDGKACILTLYNDSLTDFDSALLSRNGFYFESATELWNGSNIIMKNDKIYGKIAAGDIAVIKMN